MRLSDIERGDGLANRLLIAFISTVSGMRLPDAARVAFYHKDFLSGPLGEWTQVAMRGPSAWSISERELMAAMIAKWNVCPSCVGAHGAVAAQLVPRTLIQAALNDYHAAALPAGLIATLTFLEKMTRDPNDLTVEDARAVLAQGVSPEALEDAAAVGAIFAIVNRYATALSFAVPSQADFHRAAKRLLKRGYGA